MRGNEEISHIRGVQITKSEYNAYTPAFDVTPNRYLSGIITENGIARPPFGESLKTVVAGKPV